MMHGHEKSRSAIVAVKPTNKAERSAAESVERRAETKGNVDQQRTRRTQRRISVSQMLARIRQHIVAVETQGRSRMRESCTSGSVRGARGNSRPYRNERPPLHLLHLLTAANGTKRRRPRRRIYVSFWESSGSVWADGLGCLRRMTRFGHWPDNFAVTHNPIQVAPAGHQT